MDRAPLDALLAMRERNRFLRGMSVWVGFRQTAVAYERDARSAGRARSTRCGAMLRFALRRASRRSRSCPLQLATLLGFALALAALLGLPLTIVARYSDIYERGVPSTICSSCCCSAASS